MEDFYRYSAQFTASNPPEAEMLCFLTNLKLEPLNSIFKWKLNDEGASMILTSQGVPPNQWYKNAELTAKFGTWWHDKINSNRNAYLFFFGHEADLMGPSLKLGLSAAVALQHSRIDSELLFFLWFIRDNCVSNDNYFYFNRRSKDAFIQQHVQFNCLASGDFVPVSFSVKDLTAAIDIQSKYKRIPTKRKHIVYPKD
jgi:hypothetical protein